MKNITEYTNNSNKSAEDWDFIGFSFNGKHSIRDLNIYRTSNGNRYQEKINATVKDDTVVSSAGHGTYLFGSTVQTKVFNISFAFDQLTEEQLDDMKNTFGTQEICELIFDEYPYKVYEAKVTGTPSIEAICFDHATKGRIYKGTGKVNFTCYYPYAHTPNKPNKEGKDGKYLSYYDINIYPTLNEWKTVANLLEDEDEAVGVNRGEKPAPFIFYLSAFSDETKTTKADVPKGTIIKVAYNSIKLMEDAKDIIWNSKTGMISGMVKVGDIYIRRAINYLGRSIADLPLEENSANLLFNYI